VVKVLVVEQTWTAPGQGGADSAWGDLYGAVDIWCPLFLLHQQESAARRQALGETIWTYTALCQGEPTPWWHIDYPLLNYRVPTWVAWRYRMRGLLYWGGMSYWGPVDDPWLQAPYYTGNDAPQQGKKGVVFYGEGSLVYPGRAVGCDGVVPTIRLKALRDAIEDYDYLALLERQGGARGHEAGSGGDRHQADDDGRRRADGGRAPGARPPFLFAMSPGIVATPSPSLPWAWLAG